MKWSMRLFKIWGIDVKVHVTFILILVWAAYRWSSSTGAGWQGALFGVAATLLLFAAVTLHELGHSYQARKYGVKVQDITLMPMGGMARMDEIPEKPAQELRIAAAGPLVSFVITGVLVLVGALLQWRTLLSLSELSNAFGQVSWEGLLAYLTMANLFIGIFNLIPAFPMDGGRMLRALLAMKLDYAKATSIAVAVGQGLAWMLGLWGLLTGSYTLVLIAVFVWMGAGSEGKQVDVKQVLGEIKVGQAMTRQPAVLYESDLLRRAVDLTLSTAQVDFPVIRSADGKVVGLLTEADLIKGLRADGERAPVMRFMHTQFPTVSAGEPLVDAQKRMAEARLRALPVVGSDGALVGMLTSADANEAYRLLSTGMKLAPEAQ